MTDVFRGTTVLQVLDGAMGKLCCSDVGEFTSEDNVIVIGDVSGDCSAKGDIVVGGNLSGECDAKGGIYTPDGKLNSQTITFS